VVEGLAVSPGGDTVYACAQTAAEFYVIDARSHAVTRTVPIDGADASKKQMRRVRVSPDDKYVVVSSNQDHHGGDLPGRQPQPIASFPTRKGPMGFGFAPDRKARLSVLHDDAEVFEFELAAAACAHVCDRGRL